MDIPSDCRESPTAIRRDLAPPVPPATLGGFDNLVFLDILGRGGMGVVYRARQLDPERIVAVKVLAPELASDRGFAERFLREGKALGRLDHPHIVARYGVGQTSAGLYLVMEFVNGHTLREEINRRPPTPIEAIRILGQVCSAVQHAHDQGVVHRDLKPENILLDAVGNAKVVDFGLAKLVTRRTASEYTLTAAGERMGTPMYMAPEQVFGLAGVDHRADIFALGVVLYELLTGEVPAVGYIPPSLKAGVDRRFDAIVQRCLRERPTDRYENAADLAADLRRLLPRRRWPAWLVGGVGIAAGLCVAGMLWLASGPSTVSTTPEVAVTPTEPEAVPTTSTDPTPAVHAVPAMPEATKPLPGQGLRAVEAGWEVAKTYATTAMHKPRGVRFHPTGRVYFCSALGGVSRLPAMEGGPTESVASGNVWAFTFTPDGKTIYYSSAAVGELFRSGLGRGPMSHWKYRGVGKDADPAGLAFPPVGWKGKGHPADEGLLVDLGHKSPPSLWRLGAESPVLVSDELMGPKHPFAVAFTPEAAFVLARPASNSPPDAKEAMRNRLWRLDEGKLTAIATDRPLLHPHGLAADHGRPGDLLVLDKVDGVLLRVHPEAEGKPWTVTEVLAGLVEPGVCGVDVSADGEQLAVANSGANAVVVFRREKGP